MTSPLTERQRQLLNLLHSSEICPSILEMRRSLGVTTSGVCRLLDALEERGWIRRLPNRARAIEVLHAPPPGPLVTLTREEGLAHARAWRLRMKPHFDALYGPEARP